MRTSSSADNNVRKAAAHVPERCRNAQREEDKRRDDDEARLLPPPSVTMDSLVLSVSPNATVSTL